MKTIGLIGGMSWESTIPYYRLINETVKARLGGLHSAKIILHSVDFHDIERLQHAGDWEGGRRIGQGRAFARGGGSGLPVPLHQHHAQGRAFH
jgi:aspartate racemase